MDASGDRLEVLAATPDARRHCSEVEAAEAPGVQGIRSHAHRDATNGSQASESAEL